MKYPKINSPFNRDSKKIFLSEWSSEEFRYLYDNRWFAYEKIDGTNCRVTYDGTNVTFNGKSDQTDFTEEQLSYLESTFTKERFDVLNFEPFTMYGELVGPKCNHNYYNLKTHQFILFDALRHSTKVWQGVITLTNLSGLFDIQSSQCVGIWTLRDAVKIIQTKSDNPVYCDSFTFPGKKSEGLILRPIVPLLQFNGDRVITKLKFKDQFCEGFCL